VSARLIRRDVLRQGRGGGIWHRRGKLQHCGGNGGNAMQWFRSHPRDLPVKPADEAESRPLYSKRH
jgi:hypothetical protein